MIILLLNKAKKILAKNPALFIVIFLMLQISSQAIAQRHTRVPEGMYWLTGEKDSETNRLHLRKNGVLLIYGLNGENSNGLRTELLDKYSLIVEEGVLSEDFAMAPVASWADYVFANDYKLKRLEEVEAFIKANKHLPNIPSQTEIEKNGYSMHDMNIRMLEKIEELTLYTIDQQKEIKLLKQELSKYESLEKELEALKKAVLKNQE